ncbi:hypothetical protein ONZ45_g13022 [Pleurotus djamor]|nr:hypothetical protein ONZ45_g13022 [Pleurotus djamor]
MTAARPSNKRAPSFGALAQEARANGKLQNALTGGHKKSDSTGSRTYPSSDEEEKIRSRSAKKVRTRTGAADACVGVSPSPALNSGRKVQDPVGGSDAKISVKRTKDSPGKLEGTDDQRAVKGKGTGSRPIEKLGKALTIEIPKAKSRARPMNVQRNPSILGPELPNLAPSPRVVASPSQHQRAQSNPSPQPSSLHHTAGTLSPSPVIVNQSPALQAPQTQKLRTLRRVRRLAPSRKISFGSLRQGDGEEGDLDGEGDESLGSAFQLR